MPPKFQSSFIPKGPVVSSVSGIPRQRVVERNLFSFLAIIIFTISVVLALGVFGYKYYLNYSIASMETELESARTTLALETVQELTRLNRRIISTKTLIDRHQVLTPVFHFLEDSTPESVRFTDFDYASTDKGLTLSLKGEARGYAALALQANILSKTQDFKNPIFSDFNLDERGNVTFSLKTILDSQLLSYRREVESLDATSTPNR